MINYDKTVTVRYKETLCDTLELSKNTWGTILEGVQTLWEKVWFSQQIADKLVGLGRPELVEGCYPPECRQGAGDWQLMVCSGNSGTGRGRKPWECAGRAEGMTVQYTTLQTMTESRVWELDLTSLDHDLSWNQDYDAQPTDPATQVPPDGFLRDNERWLFILWFFFFIKGYLQLCVS